MCERIRSLTILFNFINNFISFDFTTDICTKFENLCSQICEPTDDSYVCKCRDGFKLAEDGKTCFKEDEDSTDKSNEVPINATEYGYDLNGSIFSTKYRFELNDNFKMKIVFSETAQVVTHGMNKLELAMISTNARELMSHAIWIRKCAITCLAVTSAWMFCRCLHAQMASKWITKSNSALVIG